MVIACRETDVIEVGPGNVSRVFVTHAVLQIRRRPFVYLCG